MIYEELITNFLLALAAVAVLSLVVLGNVRVVLLVCVTVVRTGMSDEHRNCFGGPIYLMFSLCCCEVLARGAR